MLIQENASNDQRRGAEHCRSEEDRSRLCWMRCARAHVTGLTSNEIWMELFRLIRLLAWEESDKGGIMAESDEDAELVVTSVLE